MIKTFVMQSGERYCLLLGSDGVPLYYPNLFVTTQVRNRSLSFSAMESTLGCLAVLNRFLDDIEESVLDRFREGRTFDENELDAIRDYCQQNFRSRAKNEKVNKSIRLDELINSSERVSSQTEYVRLSVIAKYLKWMSGFASDGANGGLSALQIQEMEKSLKSRRPVKRSRNKEFEIEGLAKDQLDLLFEVLRPESDLNPFKERTIRVRNRLVFLILFHLGLRGGELLNLRIRDIQFDSNQLVVARRSDEKDDPRKDQPLVKTLDRRLPINDVLSREIHSYIIKERRAVRNSSNHDFLFITHKAGPTEGLPLSKTAYKKVVATVRAASPNLSDLSAHRLRHAWNEVFSDNIDQMDKPPSPEQEEKIRSYLMGWKEGSGTAAIYNKRYVRRKANEAALSLQDGLIRLPKGEM